MMLETNSIGAARHRQQISDILEASRTFGLHQPLDTLLETVAAEVCRCSSYRMAVVNLVDEASGEIVVRAMAGVPPEGRRKLEGMRIPLHIVLSVLQEEFRIGQSYFVGHDRRLEIPDLDQYIFTADLGERKPGEWHQEDMLVVPIQTLEEKLLGYISVDDPSDRQLPSSDTVQALELLASVAATAIQNARLYEQAQQEITERKRVEASLKRRAIQLQAVAEVSRTITSVLDPDELFDQVVDLVCEWFDLYYVGLFLVDETGEWTGEPGRWAVLQAGTGEAGRKMLEAGHKLEVGGKSMIGWCIANTQAFIALDVGEEAVRFDNPLLPKTRSEMALPLVSRGQIIGAMTIQSTQPAAFSEEDIAVLQTMADQLANAIENARLYKETDRLRAFNENIVQSMEEGILLEDANGHITFANRRMAELLGYTPEELIGQHWMVTAASEEMAKIEEEVAKRRQGITSRYETVLLTKEGQRVPAIVSATPLFDGGLFTGVLAAFTDITDRKRQETRLRDYLSTVTSSLAQHTSIEGLYEFIVEAGARFLSACDCALFLVSDNNSSELKLIAAVAPPLCGDRSSSVSTAISASPGCGLVAHVAETCQPIRLLGEEIFQHPSWNKELWTRLGWDFDTQANHSLLAAPMSVPDGRLVGVLIARDAESQGGFSEFDEVLIKTLATNAAADIERVRGLEKAREDAIRAERKRLETDLHEAMNLLTTGVRWEAEILSDEIDGNDLAAERIALTRLQAALARAYTDLRYLLEDLRDPTLEQKGLLIALKKRAELIGRGRVVVHSGFRQRLPPKIEGALYRAGQEAMSNAVKHSGVVHDPEVKIEVWLEWTNGLVKLCVKDDGVGFDVESTLALSHKWGLRRLSDALHEMGGKLDIDSAPGKGTTICATIDLTRGDDG